MLCTEGGWDLARMRDRGRGGAEAGGSSEMRASWKDGYSEVKDLPSERGTVYFEKSKPFSCCRLSRVGSAQASCKKVKKMVKKKNTTEP